MKAAVLHRANEPLTIEEVSLAKPGPREVLIRTVAAGICHSDLHFADGAYPHPMPCVLGHESGGDRRSGGRGCDLCEAGRPRRHLPLRLLRLLRAMPDRPSLALPDRRNQAPAGRLAAPFLERRADAPVPQPLLLCRADAGA